MRDDKDIVIVANRLPVHRVRSGANVRWARSAGGLVSAMSPVLEKRGGNWIGWSGAADSTNRPFMFEGVRIVPVPLSAREVDTYYEGFCNATIWPLYHDAIRPPVFEHAWWKPYVEVNRRYAQVAARVAGRGGSVWVHDYQLQLVPRMLRELRPDLRIGFFLHIPFPPDELFAWLPWRREILEGMLGANVVGFQTPADAQDFSRAARLFTSAEGTDSVMEYKGRKVKSQSFPISIDFGWFNEKAATPDTARRSQHLRKQVGAARRIMFSVDRLDYSKGIDHRLLAFEELLRRKVVSVEDCVLVQIAVPSRETVAEYVKLRQRIEQIVGRINGEFSKPGHVPVYYFRRSVSMDELVAFYAAADVMVVTPLRDGMNLVAKEYVATRLDNSGVLILSEFAGASRELHQALLVNPHDIEGTVRAMDLALHMPRKESRWRMSIMRTQVRRHDVHFWAGEFLEALDQ
jgi:trehalose 6-phosphate synthase